MPAVNVTAGVFVFYAIPISLPEAPLICSALFELLLDGVQHGVLVSGPVRSNQLILRSVAGKPVHGHLLRQPFQNVADAGDVFFHGR